HCEQAYHMFYLLMPSLEARSALIAKLKRRAIHAVFHYVPLHTSPMGRRFGGRPGQCPAAEDVSERLVRPPFFTDVSDAEEAPVVLVGAHYDSAGTPGADDNGSGVAALLEITRQLAGAKLGRKLRCVAFTNEEPPFFDTDQMGSRVYAQLAAARGDRIEAMLS